MNKVENEWKRWAATVAPGTPDFVRQVAKAAYLAGTVSMVGMAKAVDDKATSPQDMKQFLARCMIEAMQMAEDMEQVNNEIISRLKA